MAKESRTHHADEFGKGTSGAIGGFDPPMIGAPASILTDALVERESGVTPSPWSVSVKGIVVFLVAMFLLGVILAVIGLGIQQRMFDADGPTTPPQRVTTYDPAWDPAWAR